MISSSDAKLERVRAMGAQHTINYRTEPDWEKKVVEITGGRGVNLTLEVGGTGTLTKTLRAASYAGHISLIGVLGGISGDVQIAHILHKALTIRGIYVGSRDMFVDMNQIITQDKLEPVIDRVFPLRKLLQLFVISKMPGILERSSSTSICNSKNVTLG